MKIRGNSFLAIPAVMILLTVGCCVWPESAHAVPDKAPAIQADSDVQVGPSMDASAVDAGDCRLDMPAYRAVGSEDDTFLEATIVCSDPEKFAAAFLKFKLFLKHENLSYRVGGMASATDGKYHYYTIDLEPIQ